MLVDYNVASLMLPMIILGASIGVMLNKIIPAIVISILLTLLLLVVSIIMLKKVIGIVRLERVKFGPLCGSSKKLNTVAIIAPSQKTT